MTATFTPALAEDALYFGDNGRVLCHRSHCAGMAAQATGLDLSGHPVERVTDAHIVEWATAPDLGPLTCECGGTTLRLADSARHAPTAVAIDRIRAAVSDVTLTHDEELVLSWLAGFGGSTVDAVVSVLGKVREAGR